MADLLIRRVPEALVRSLKSRAVRHRRSLQRELIAILESAAGEDEGDIPARIAAVVRARLAQAGRRRSDSVVSIRQERSR